MLFDINVIRCQAYKINLVPDQSQACRYFRTYFLVMLGLVLLQPSSEFTPILRQLNSKFITIYSKDFYVKDIRQAYV